jgi:hypothetical protein
LQAAPAVFGNAMPKSGSHLLHQILLGLLDLGPFVDPGWPPVNRDQANRKRPQAQILSGVNAMQAGEIRYGYLHAERPWLEALTRPGLASFFVHRDPRDWVISQIFYALDMHPGHMLHRHYQTLPDMEARIDAAIRGVDTPDLKAPSVAERYGHYLGWLDIPGICVLRFEDLINDRETALATLLDHLGTHVPKRAGAAPWPLLIRTQAIQTLANAIAPRKSGTFRKGQPGEWREHFTEANQELFEAQAKGLLERLGYAD